MKSRTYFAELPFHALIETNITKLSDEELRAFTDVVKERRQSSQKRRSDNAKTAKHLSGKQPKIDIADLIK